MKKNCIAAAIVVAGTLLILASPSRAQIASTLDERGKLVFVNRDSPSPRHGSTMSLNSAGMPGPLFASTESSANRLERIVRSAAERHKVDPALVKAVISTASGGNPRATPSKG